MKNLSTICCIVLLLMAFPKFNPFAQKTPNAIDIIGFEISKFIFVLILPAACYRSENSPSIGEMPTVEKAFEKAEKADFPAPTEAPQKP